MALFVLFGTMAVFQVRTRMAAARLGSDITYAIDERGDATVRMLEKTYFVDAETERNFDGMVARAGEPDAEKFGVGIQESVKGLGETIGRPGMDVSGFRASFRRMPDYGAREYSFRWTGFAERREQSWVVDFRAAEKIKLTKDSSLVVVLPPGAGLVSVDPLPKQTDARTLIWSGPLEIPWPYIEYR